MQVDDACSHPNWSMGRKITVDSATLMNKGLEVIEAHYLYGTDYDNIEIVVHPQSIIHSMVETADSSVLGQVRPPRAPHTSPFISLLLLCVPRRACCRLCVHNCSCVTAHRTIGLQPPDTVSPRVFLGWRFRVVLSSVVRSCLYSGGI